MSINSLQTCRYVYTFFKLSNIIELELYWANWINLNWCRYKSWVEDLTDMYRNLINFPKIGNNQLLKIENIDY